MTKVSVNIKMEYPMDEEDLFTHLDGSGWEHWGWGWSQVVTNDEGTSMLEIHMDDPDDNGSEDPRQIIKSFTAEQVAEAISNMPPEETFTKRAWRDLRNDDMDAETADIVMQWLVFGEMVYG